jgi:hypothetical protein
MVTLVYEYQGRRVKPEELRDPAILGWGNEILNVLTPVRCPICQQSSQIAILLSSSGAQFHTKLQSVCHIEFSEIANDLLPQLLKFS